MNLRSISIRTLVLLPAALFVLSACTEDKLVSTGDGGDGTYRPPFNPPADSVNGFLGLYDVATNKTTCGNCHVNNQGEWAGTKHADAFATLVNSGGAQSFCYACHTVSANGNKTALAGQPAGWDVKEDSTYRNVQCESCHGPGLEHVSNPTSLNVPLARAVIPTSPDSAAIVAATCAGCHQGTHHPFVEQWEASAHANFRKDEAPGVNNGPAVNTSSGCVNCHNGKYAMQVLSGNAPTNYVERDKPLLSTTFPITCPVCHDPHYNGNEGQLRRSISDPEPSTNLCSTCHIRGATPSLTFTITSRGAHASQGAVYFGEAAGWQPPGFTFDENNPIYTAHLSRNDRKCAGCHVAKFTTTDTDTGEPFTSVGHLFSPNPCKGANGLPTEGDCAYNATARFWTGCVNSGCHASETEAAGLFNSKRATVKLLLDNLWTDTNGNQVLEGTDGGVLAAVLRQHPGTLAPAADSAWFCCTDPDGSGPLTAASDKSLSIAEGALWNARMLGENLYSHNDGSFGIHNPALYEGLIASSINAVRTKYNLPAGIVSASAEAAITKALTTQGVRYAPPEALRQTAAR